MTEPPAAEAQVPTSLRRRSRWPNLIWVIPAGALVIVVYLGFEAIANRGETVTVTFGRAAGARAGETKVLYQGVEAGQLVKIEPNKDGRSLDFKLHMRAEAKPGLNTNARFWLIGASPNLSDLSSLKAVVSGVAIGYAPGEGGEPTRSFRGLQSAPIILPSDKGVRHRLVARKLNSIREGSVVLFHGQEIGKVIKVTFDGKDAFNVEIFVFEPFDKLITSSTRFWKISPVRLNVGDGISASLAPVGALLAGGIEIDVHPDGTDAEPPAQPPQPFILYESRRAARAGLAGPTVSYEFLFKGDPGTLEREAAVTLLGFDIGEVRSVRLTYDPRTGEPQTLAVADIYPQQMHLEAATGPGDGWRQVTDAKFGRLVQVGYRARLRQRPLLLGDEAIALVKTPGAPAARLEIGDRTRFPTVAAGDGLDGLTAQASELLAHLNAVPFAAIGGDLRVVSGRLRQFADSPELQSSLAHASATVASLDGILRDAQPQIGPLLEHLKDTADQLSGVAADAHRLLGNQVGDANLDEAISQMTEAARSIGSLSDYLSRHPEALLRGRRPTP